MRIFFSTVVLLLVFVFPILQCLATCCACLVARNSSAPFRLRFLHFLQFLTEWACVDVAVLALVVFGPDIGRSSTLNDEVGLLHMIFPTSDYI